MDPTYPPPAGYAGEGGNPNRLTHLPSASFSDDVELDKSLKLIMIEIIS
jgi:hypothetical protein